MHPQMRHVYYCINFSLFTFEYQYFASVLIDFMYTSYRKADM